MDAPAKTQQNKRYRLLDTVRGVCILGMIAYHTLFDIVAFFGVPINESLFNVINVVRDFGACCFICLAGICMHFGKKPLKRILLLSAASLIVSAVSFFAVPDMPIYFGILTFMAASAVIMLPLQKFLDRLPPVPFLILSFLLFLVTFEVSGGYIGYYDLVVAILPEWLYRNFVTAFFGFPFIGFATSDYYPLLPWIFMFFTGFFMWNAVKGKEKVNNVLKFGIKPFEKIGRLSLYIYMAHQPVIFGVLLLISFIVS